MKGLKDIAISALVQVAQNEEAPDAARAQAARTLLELEKLIGSNALDGSESREDTEKTLAELDQELAALEGRK